MSSYNSFNGRTSRREFTRASIETVGLSRTAFLELREAVNRVRVFPSFETQTILPLWRVLSQERLPRRTQTLHETLKTGALGALNHAEGEIVPLFDMLGVRSVHQTRAIPRHPARSSHYCGVICQDRKGSALRSLSCLRMIGERSPITLRTNITYLIAGNLFG